MITKEQARGLKKGDIVHTYLNPGEKCEEFEVVTTYTEYNFDWLVRLCNEERETAAGISGDRMTEWHLPGECSPPSRNLRVDIHRIWDNRHVGTFYIGMDDTEEFLQLNIPILVRSAQILAGESFPGGR